MDQGPRVIAMEFNVPRCLDTCTRSNLRSIESWLFERDALGFGTAN